jgi:hypothetical protein
MQECEQCNDIALLDLLGDLGYKLAESDRKLQHVGGED